MASRGKAGGQNKVPRMDNTGAMTADIAKWMEENGDAPRHGLGRARLLPTCLRREPKLPTE